MSAVERVMAMAIAVEFRIPSARTRLKGPVETSDPAETFGSGSSPSADHVPRGQSSPVAGRVAPPPVSPLPPPPSPPPPELDSSGPC